jgi:hypothetical protein
MTNPTGHLAPFPASARPLRALRMHGPTSFHYGTEVALGDGTSALHICWTREIWMKDNTGPGPGRGGVDGLVGDCRTRGGGRGTGMG